jgi:hypothetical protein
MCMQHFDVHVPLQGFHEELNQATLPRVLREGVRVRGPGGAPAGELRELLSNARKRLTAVSAPPASMPLATACSILFGSVLPCV